MNDAHTRTRCAAFEDERRIASGALPEVAAKVKEAIDRGADGTILIFDAHTSRQVEIDFRGSKEDVLRRIADADPASAPAAEPDASAPRGPGRPKLGVVAREVTLLPRHWEWLAEQPGGASVALRKLVDEARKNSQTADRVRRAQEATHRFLSVMAGNRPGFEEAMRVLFAGDRPRFDALIAAWPVDIRDHAQELAAEAFQVEAE